MIRVTAMVPTINIFFTDVHNRILFSVAIMLSFLLLHRIFAKYIIHLLTNLTNRTESTLDDKLLCAFEQPMKYLIIILGVYLSLISLPYFSVDNIFISRIFRSAIIIIIAWGIYNIEGECSAFESLTAKLGLQFNEILVPIFSKTLKIITVLLAITIIAQEWKYDIDGFIAGLGLGGLAFALAAKDSLANFFGGIVIILDKPFTIGDWVESSHGEGVVEEVSFRSTKIRTFAQSLVIIPNSILANTAIINWSKMGKRRLTFNLGVTYSTSKQQLQNCITQIKQMLTSHPEIHPDTIFVSLDKFNSSSIDIFIYCFTKTTNWETFLSVKQDINFKILDILSQEQVSIAFPSTSVYIENQMHGNKSS